MSPINRSPSFQAIAEHRTIFRGGFAGAFCMISIARLSGRTARLDHDAKRYRCKVMQRNRPWNDDQLERLAQMRDQLSDEKTD